MDHLTSDVARLVRAAMDAAEALADAEHIGENEWGRACRRKEWEARTDEHGPSEELKALRAALVPFFFEKAT